MGGAEVESWSARDESQTTQMPPVVMPTSGKAPDVGYSHLFLCYRAILPLKIGPTRQLRSIER